MPRRAAKDDLIEAFRKAGVRDVEGSQLARSLYASDASLYRIEPRLVVHPRDADEVAAVVAVCRDAGVPVTPRGAGTSIAGNAVGAGVILDTSRHLRGIVDISQTRQTATVQPGVVNADLQCAATPLGLRFGPDPSSRSRCTIGGMVANNACGSHALAYGRTSDNVVSLEGVTADGRRVRLAKGSASPFDSRLIDIASDNLATIRTEFATFARQGSGYALEHLLPERGLDIPKLIAGSEGTLFVITEATVRLVPEPESICLIVLGYDSITDAADAAPGLIPLGPTACEGLDSRIVDSYTALRGSAARPRLPEGSAWLILEFTGPSRPHAIARARSAMAASGAIDALITADPNEMAGLWRLREAGAGLATIAMRPPGRAGWEDSAVPPARLGAYLRDLDALLASHHLRGVPYGHFGDGCVHMRIDFPVDHTGGAAALAAFAREAAALVASHGGSLSGEHGDGRARSGLLEAMYSRRARRVMAAVKHVFDPAGLLNPGIVTAPVPLTDDLRATGAETLVLGGLRFATDGGDFSAAVHRCTGIGACVAPRQESVMCPSYAATGLEKDSTRGRARVLQDLVGGKLGEDSDGPDWSATEVSQALDLCLACKGCRTDCPSGVDMAAYKVEVLHQRYRHRRRPASHYTLGWLPRWLTIASVSPATANALMAGRVTGRVIKLAAGIDRRRSLPLLAPTTFHAWARSRPPRVANPNRPRVVVWADTFTDTFAPGIGRAAVEVLEVAGYQVEVPKRSMCCGLTWLSTGQVEAARRVLARTMSALSAYADDGALIVGLEPSCTALLRSDAAELLDDSAVARVASSVLTLAEALAEAPDWTPPDLSGVEVVAQPHCHQASGIGWSTDRDLLARAGAQVTTVGGCCGMAGSFGFERRHFKTSLAIAETQLLPAVRDSPPDAVVLADGFSCRTQIDQLAGVNARHLAEFLAPTPGSGHGARAIDQRSSG